MPQNIFAILSKAGSVGLGEFTYPNWHKEEKENLIKKLGLKIEHGEPLAVSSAKNTGDIEHSKMLKAYLDEGLSMMKIAVRMNRSSGTIYNQIKRHNVSIERSGFCPVCRRAGGDFEKQLAKQSRRGQDI